MHHRQQLNEGLGYKDMEGMMKPTVHIDEFSSKMGEDADVIVVSFFVRDKQAAKDLMNWFEKGYDFVLDADQSPGEIKPNRYLVYLEMRRRNAAPGQIDEILRDLNTLTEYEPDDWIMVYKKKKHEWSPETFAELVPLTPNEYRARTEGDLNEMRIKSAKIYKLCNPQLVYYNFIYTKYNLSLASRLNVSKRRLYVSANSFTTSKVHGNISTYGPVLCVIPGLARR